MTCHSGRVAARIGGSESGPPPQSQQQDPVYLSPRPPPGLSGMGGVAQAEGAHRCCVTNRPDLGKPRPPLRAAGPGRDSPVPLAVCCP